MNAAWQREGESAPGLSFYMSPQSEYKQSYFDSIVPNEPALSGRFSEQARRYRHSQLNLINNSNRKSYDSMIQTKNVPIVFNDPRTSHSERLKADSGLNFYLDQSSYNDATRYAVDSLLRQPAAGVNNQRVLHGVQSPAVSHVTNSTPFPADELRRKYLKRFEESNRGFDDTYAKTAGDLLLSIGNSSQTESARANQTLPTNAVYAEQLKPSFVRTSRKRPAARNMFASHIDSHIFPGNKQKQQKKRRVFIFAI
jgi:hypothetical protein